MLRVNLYGALFMTQAALPALLRHPGSSIVNVASLAGRRGVTPLGGYCATQVRARWPHRGAAHRGRQRRSCTSAWSCRAWSRRRWCKAIDQVEALPEWPAQLNMPADWVAAAVALAVRFRLREVSVPPGAALLEELGALVPGATDVLIGWMSAAGRWLNSGARG